MKKRNEKVKDFLKVKAAKISIVIALTIGAVILIGSYVRQADQVAQLKELNDQLILEQRKEMKERDNDVAELKKLVANQEAKYFDLANNNEKIQEQNKKLLKDNENLIFKNNALESSKTDLLKKYRELVKP